MKWFDSNPYGANPSMRQEFAYDVHQWGRQNFASNFSRGGFATTAFAPTPGEAFKSVFRGKSKFGSQQNISNMDRMASLDPDLLNQPAYKEQYQKAINGPKRVELLGKAKGMTSVMGKALPVGFLALPAFMTPGGAKEKGRAVFGGAASYLGWAAGSKLGMATGAALGSVIPGFGTAIGAGVGYLVGGMAGAIGVDEGVQALSRIPDRMVQRERDRRALNWVGDQSAFQTQSASTMRQQSLMAMSRGMMNARSALGREGMMMHQ